MGFDPRLRRIERELMLTAFGVKLETFDAWLIDRLTSAITEHIVHPGDLLWPAGRPIGSVYFIRSGRVHMTREGVPPWIFEGDWFLGGFDVHLERGPKRSAVAAGEFYVLEISRRAWLDLLEDSFEMTRRSFVAMAGTIARLEQQLPPFDSPPRRASVLPPEPRPLDAIERLALLTEHVFSRGAGVQALADLAASSREVFLEGGATLFERGAEREDAFFVLTGEIEAQREQGAQPRRYVAGDLVTGAAALSDDASRWSARATSKAQLLAIPIEAWFDLMEEHFEFARATLSALALRRETLADRLAEQAGPEGVVFK